MAPFAVVPVASEHDDAADDGEAPALFVVAPQDAEGLADLTLEQLEGGFENAVKTCKFMPTVAEIRAVANMDLETAMQLTAERDWEQVERIAAYIGTTVEDRVHYEKLAKLSPAVQWATKSVGSLVAIRNASLTDLRFIKQRWMESYRTAQRAIAIGMTDDSARELLDGAKAKLGTLKTLGSGEKA